MALNIKDEEAHRLALELARRNGETVTMAVKIAIRERLERQNVTPRRKSRSEILAEFSERLAPLFKDGRSGNELINDLYDEEIGAAEMIVDSSAIIAVLKRESNWVELSDTMNSADALRMSAASYLEIAIVVDGLRDPVQSAGLLGYHLKSGHTLSVQNRPTGLAEDVIVLPCSSVCMQGEV